MTRLLAAMIERLRRKRPAVARPVKPYRRPNDNVQAMLRAFKVSSVARPPD